MTTQDQRQPVWAGIIAGMIIAGLGILLLIDQTGLLGWEPSWSIWPFLIIGMGLARFAAPRPDGSRDAGGWLIVVGVWLLMHQMRVLRFRDSWPLILVALGIHTMWKALVRPRASRSHAGQS